MNTLAAFAIVVVAHVVGVLLSLALMLATLCVVAIDAPVRALAWVVAATARRRA